MGSNMKAKFLVLLNIQESQNRNISEMVEVVYQGLLPDWELMFACNIGNQYHPKEIVLPTTVVKGI